MKIHHIGYSVKNINQSINGFKKLGYNLEGELIKDINRKVCIQFLILNEYRIELVAPLAKESPLDNILRKNGEGPYHICYETDNIDNAINKLVNEKYILVENKSKAVAINCQNVAFLFKKGIGLIELVEI